jgi:cell wall-associated NlpC family hydrolase
VSGLPQATPLIRPTQVGPAPVRKQSAVRSARESTATASTLRSRIVSIALSQVGVDDIPPVTSYDSVDCDPYTTMVGPDFPEPSSRGCGFDSHFGVEDENEEWCADFADWVWQRAGVTKAVRLLNPGANSFYAWGVAEHETSRVDASNPKVGDAVVFYPPGPITVRRLANHVGIVTGVNRNGTVNLVDGDFLGRNGIGVEYNPGVDLGPWSSAVWSAGEQWVFVSPPTAPQPPVPTAVISGPQVVAADTSVTFSAHATEQGGAITAYAWAFGDGVHVTGGAAKGPLVQHVFATAGLKTVTMIVTSSRDTMAVRTLNVEVITTSSTAIETPSDAVYYTATPMTERLFLSRPTGGLGEESFDGADWLDEGLPGAAAPDGSVTALSYKDPQDSLEPHVFARSSSGGLTDTSREGAVWTTAVVPGSPSAGTPLVATMTAGGPEIFYFAGDGHLAESFEVGGSWRSRLLPVPPTTAGALGIGTAFASDRPTTELFSLSRLGALVVTSSEAGRWEQVTIPSTLRLAPQASIAVAEPTTGAGAPVVFSTDASGYLVEATLSPATHSWSIQQISETRSMPSAGLLATNVVFSSAELSTEVFSLSASGEPLLSSLEGGTWSTAVLPGSAMRLLGLSGYPAPEGTERLYLGGPAGIEADLLRPDQGTLDLTTTASLPTSETGPTGRIVLYAATPAGLRAATHARALAGLPATAVTGSYAVAWDDALSSDYLVVAVGVAATDALSFNACGWANPSEDGTGSTPFNVVSGLQDGPPGATNFEEAAGATESDTAALADDLAFYAVHHRLPAAATVLPSLATPELLCRGEPLL